VKMKHPIPPPQTGDHKVSSQIGVHTDKQLLKEFLAGDFCIHGVGGVRQFLVKVGAHEPLEAGRSNGPFKRLVCTDL
jgi:hypothetical protein